MDRIGRYRLERRIGAGSFATVWLGHDDDLDVAVAVKLLAENWADNDDVRNRFLAEARIMRRIHDPRLVQVYDIGTLEDGRPYFVMDYINGGSLADLRRQRPDPVRALELCAESCRAIQVLHDHGVIHRDVTPGNLLLDADGRGRTRVRIADLGVAKSMVDVVGATMTAGTPTYMAPEQASGGVPLDQRADIYSLTAVTYSMLTGQPPFRVQGLTDILTRDPAATPPPVAAQLGAPAALDTVLTAGLAYDRDRRPPTATVLADALDTLARQIGAGIATRPIPVTAPAAPTPSAASAPSAAPRLADPRSAASAPRATPYAQSASSAAPPPAPVSPPPGYPSANPAGPSWDVGAFPAGYGGDAAPYAEEEPAADEPAQGHSAAYYALLAVAAVALFAIAMFVTILLLR